MIERLEALRAENMKHCGFGTEEMMKIRICTQCGEPSPSEARFCRECGHQLPPKTLYEVYKERHKACPDCGTVVTDNSEYCPQCGSRLPGREHKKDPHHY